LGAPVLFWDKSAVHGMEASSVSHHQKIEDINQLLETDGDWFGTCLVSFLLHFTPNETVLPIIRSLSKNLRAVQHKRSQMSDKKLLSLHDNARPHTAHATANLLEPWCWEILEHPPYSPDLAPSDFLTQHKKHRANRFITWGVNVAAWLGSHLSTGFWEMDFPPRKVSQQRWLEK